MRALRLRGQADDGGGQDADGPGQAPAGIAGEDDERGRQGAQAAAERVGPGPGEGGRRLRSACSVSDDAGAAVRGGRGHFAGTGAGTGTAELAQAQATRRTGRSHCSSMAVPRSIAGDPRRPLWTTSPCGRRPLAMMDPWQVGRRLPDDSSAGHGASAAVCRRCGTSCSDRTPTGSCSCSSSSTTCSSRSGWHGRARPGRHAIWLGLTVLLAFRTSEVPHRLMLVVRVAVAADRGGGDRRWPSAAATGPTARS